MKKTTEELLKTLTSKKDYEEFRLEEAEELNVPTLEEFLEGMLREKGLKKSEVIRKSNLDKNYAYQLFNGTKTNPSRSKLIMLAFGIGLDHNETRRLLRCAKVGELYPRSPEDSVIIYCLAKGCSLMTCNEYLSDLSLNVLE